MKQNKSMVACVILAVTLSAVSVALQIKKAVSPFDKYRQSTANELALRIAMFDVAALQQRVPYENGILVPKVEGFSEDGKLVIEVDVSSDQLPKTVEARKEAMLEALGVARAGFSGGFGVLAENTDFNKWTRVEFFDVDTVMKSTLKKPLDPVIGIYENGELVLR